MAIMKGVVPSANKTAREIKNSEPFAEMKSTPDWSFYAEKIIPLYLNVEVGALSSIHHTGRTK
jgi:hypothetical protein